MLRQRTLRESIKSTGGNMMLFDRDVSLPGVTLQLQNTGYMRSSATSQVCPKLVI